ncbi:MAG: prepilin peptidase [Terracidiphilus sp.]|jgi:leader peptidase (prepilin peptidase) / N-methyltransferase
MIRTLGTVFSILAGLAFGSFMNVCLSRWLASGSVVNPQSRCRGCESTPAWWENLSLMSWLVRRGRCRHCHTRMSWRYPLVELSVGAIWGLLAWRLMDLIVNTRYGFTLPYLNLEYTAGIMIFCWTLVGIATLDARHFNLSDLITLPGVAIGVVFYILTSEQMVWSFVTELTPIQEVGRRLFAVIAAGGLVMLIRWVYWLIRRQKILGLGEANLMAMLAAWLGLPGALLAFGIGVLLGTAMTLAYLAVRAAGRNPEGWKIPELPLGTFVCTGGIVSCLWGPQIISAYIHFSGQY